MSDEYIDTNEVAEIVADDDANAAADVIDGDGDIDVDVDGDGDIDNMDDLDDNTQDIIVDLSNNSTSYFDQHKDSIFLVASHPTLPLVVTGGGDNTAYIWTTHLKPPKVVTTINSHKESVIAGGFSADGSFLVTGDMNGKVVVHKSAKRGQMWSFFGEIETVNEIIWIQMHPNRPVFAFGGNDGSVWWYQVTDSDVELISSGFSHQSECNYGEFANIKDNDTLTTVTCSEDGTAVIWNGYTGESVHKFAVNSFKGMSPPWVSVAVDDSSSVAAMGSRDGYLAIISTKTGNLVDFFPAYELKEDQDIYDASIEAISWCPSLKMLTAGFVSGDMYWYDSKTWTVRRKLQLEDAITKTLVVRDHVLIVSCMNGHIYEYDLRKGDVLFEGTGHNMGVLDFAVQDNGHKLVTGSDEGVSLIFEDNSGSS